MEKMGKSSEFTAAYKLKSGSSLQKRDARLSRRSIEWKTLRGEEVSKRRNLKNLSPLQEGKENLSQRSTYKDKTPTKPTKVDKATKQNEMKAKLKKWREEKALKKKMEAHEKAKKRPFIIKHMEYSDNLEVSKVKKGVAETSKTKSSTMPLQAKSFNKETKVNKFETVQKRHGNSSVTKQDSTRKKGPNKPVTERVTRTTNQRAGKTTQPAQTSVKKSKDKKAPVKKSAQGGVDKATVDLTKVSTARGMSFAPEEFTFTAPNNLVSFVFKPLSPTSSENFLYSNNPDETAVFSSTDPGRCSTPKKTRTASVALSDEEKTGNKSSKDDNVANVPTDSTRNRRQTRSQTKSVSQKNESLNSVEKSSAIETKPTSRKSTAKEVETPSKSRKSMEKTPRSRKSVSNALSAGPKPESRKRSSSRELPSRSRSRKRSHSRDEESTTKRRKSRRSVSVKPGGNVKVDVINSPEQQQKETSDSTDQVMEDTEMTKDNEVESAETCDQQDNDELGSTRSVKLTNHSLTVEVTEDINDSLNEPKSSPSVPKRKSRRSIKTPCTLSEDVKEISSKNTEKEIVEEKPSVKARRKSRVSVNLENGISDNTKELASELEESNEVFAEENSSPAPKRKSRRSIRMRPDFAEIPEDLTAGNKENSKPKQVTRRSVAVVDGFKLPSESMSAKRTKPKQRRHTLHVHRSPEEWVEILKSSPMIEMTRKTPKQKSPVSKIPSLDLELDLDDLDLPPKEDIKSDLDISKVIMANLNSSVLTDEDVAAVEETLESSAKEMNTEESTLEKKGVESMDTDEMAADTVVPLQESTSGINSTEGKQEPEHDVKYFRNLLSSETNRLNALSEKWEGINTPDLSEEVQGQIRTVIGQAQLLIAQRFKQFTGLVDNCEFKTGEKETTCTDLQGFWDMIYFQVEDVDKKFEDLQERKESGWVKKSPELVKKVVKKKVVNKPVIKKPVKSKFAAFKASLKASTAPAQTIEHDWGLFKVTSPIRKPTYHCEAGSPKPKSVESPKPKEELPMPLQPKSGEEIEPMEDSTSQPAVVQDKPPAILVEDVAMIRTPKRQSYVPVIPSPLLQDSTPQPRFTRSLLKATPSGNQTEEKTETPRPRRQSLRRSINMKRKSVSFVEEPVKPESPADESFSKYLQPSQPIPEETESPVSVMDSYFSVEEDDHSRLSSGGKALKTTLKQSRRRSARRSVSFCSPLPEKDKSCLRHPPTPHRSLVDDPDSDSDSQSDTGSKFSSLNVAFTPVTRSTRSRPSLLYTPPDLQETPSKGMSSEVATGTLISFTP
ncbi:neurofilament heavy polypeptide-like [Saccostrea cucullata]|uniref:neurofilament heavy polypeptide-like n=1 Tax=Saccostrea cuccullata TaxID=36930 RepID=UPI002ED1F26D